MNPTAEARKASEILRKLSKYYDEYDCRGIKNLEDGFAEKSKQAQALALLVETILL